MILKGSQRAGGKALALHLLRTDENDHVEVHQLRGFVSDNLVNALREAYAISRGTRCTQFLFSLSLNPPQTENVPVAVFEKAINEIEERLGLSGQPRAIVFHEKNGRRHAHCVWSRIDATTLKAINLPHFKLKLREASRQIYLEHGWKMPPGLADNEERNPLNFSREEWQQAKRIDRDPQTIKKIFVDAWAISDSLKAFKTALESRGYYLAQGDRRGHVAVDWMGEVYPISRWAGVKAKDVVGRLGDPSSLPTVAETNQFIQARLSEKVLRFDHDARREFDNTRMGLKSKRDDLVRRQRAERTFLADIHAARWVQEARIRAERFRKGLRGLWDRLVGKARQTREMNELEISRNRERDAAEKQQMVDWQLEERRLLQSQIRTLQELYERDAAKRQSLLLNPDRRAVDQRGSVWRKRSLNEGPKL